MSKINLTFCIFILLRGVVNGLDCSSSGVIPAENIINEEQILLTAECPDSYFQITLDPDSGSKGGLLNLTISDDFQVLVDFPYAEENITEILQLNSASSNVLFEGGSSNLGDGIMFDWDLDISYQEIGLTVQETNIRYGNGSLDVTDLVPNHQRALEFRGSKSRHLFEVDWDFGNQVSTGFVAIKSNNGRMGILNVKNVDNLPMSLIVMADVNETTTGLEMVMQNSPNSFSYSATIEYSLGEDVPTTTSTTTTTSPTPDPDEPPIEIFVIAVNEQKFYEEDFTNFKMEIENLAQGNGQCDFLFSYLRSCRQECHMTSSPDRGCVSFTVFVQSEDIYCFYTNRQLRKDLEDNLDSWANEYHAREIVLDDCLEDVRSWKIMTIALPIVSIGLIVIGLILMKCLVSPRRGQPRKGKPYKNNSRGSFSQIMDREQTRLDSAGSGSHSPYYSPYVYSNNLEVVDE